MGRIILFDWANVILDCYSGIYSIHDAQRDIAAHLRPENAGELIKIFADDRPENTLRADAAGWNTLTATGNEFETIRKKCLAFAAGKRQDNN